MTVTNYALCTLKCPGNNTQQQGRNTEVEAFCKVARRNHGVFQQETSLFFDENLQSLRSDGDDREAVTRPARRRFLNPVRQALLASLKGVSNYCRSSNDGH
jgi:hypothetical protein